MVSDVCEMYGMFSFPSRAALPRRSVQPYVGVSKFKEDVKKISVCSALFMCISLFYGFVFFYRNVFLYLTPAAVVRGGVSSSLSPSCCK